MNHSVFSRVKALALSLGVLSLLSCGSSTDERLAIAKLKQACLINSDCSEQQVCAFKTCHIECATSKDCEDGARCVAGDRPNKICQKEEEKSCENGSGCLGDQSCAPDLLCRDHCSVDSDCIGEQKCISGTCAEPEELNDEGEITVAEELPPGYVFPCAYHSDCPDEQLCADGSCRARCLFDRHCPLTEVCSDGACVPEGQLFAQCWLHSDCAATEECQQGSCQPLGAGTCTLNSHCDTAGQSCVNRHCECECEADSDCGIGGICLNSCQCDYNTTAYGFFKISNQLDVQELMNTKEIIGSVIIEWEDDTTPLKLDNLKAIRGSLVISQTNPNYAVSMAGLEEIDGELIYQISSLKATLELPLLNRVGGIRWNCESSGMATLSLPSLTSCNGDLVFDSDTDLEGFELPKLAAVSGNFYVRGMSSLTAFSAPLLASVGKGFLYSNNNGILPFLEFPTLGSVGEIFDVANNGELKQMLFPLLGKTGGIGISDNPKLSVLDMPVLESIGGPGMVLTRLPFLAELKLPLLKATIDEGQLTLEELALLSVIELNAIDTIVGRLTVRNIAKLSKFALPSLNTAQGIDIDNCAELNEVELQVNSIGKLGLGVLNNPKLQTIRLDALKQSGAIQINQNKELIEISLAALEIIDAPENIYALNIEGNGNLSKIDSLWKVPNIAASKPYRISNNQTLLECTASAVASYYVDSSAGTNDTSLNLYCSGTCVFTPPLTTSPECQP